MVLKFIILELQLTNLSPAEIYQASLEQIQQHGTPLRWAITNVDADSSIAKIEAVITS